MRALVDLRDSQLRALDRLAKRLDRSRAALIREAVDDYLGRNDPVGDDEAFGAWGAGAVEGLSYQERARAEW